MITSYLSSCQSSAFTICNDNNLIICTKPPPFLGYVFLTLKIMCEGVYFCALIVFCHMDLVFIYGSNCILYVLLKVNKFMRNRIFMSNIGATTTFV